MLADAVDAYRIRQLETLLLAKYARSGVNRHGNELPAVDRQIVQQRPARPDPTQRWEPPAIAATCPSTNTATQDTPLVRISRRLCGPPMAARSVPDISASAEIRLRTARYRRLCERAADDDRRNPERAQRSGPCAVGGGV